MSGYAKVYIGAVMGGGVLCLAYGAATWHCQQPLHYACLLVIALLASGLKVSVPRVNTTLSASYVCVLLSMIDFSYAETLVVACLAAAVQSLWHTQTRPKVLHLLFNLASLAIAVWAGCTLYAAAPARWHVLPALGIALTGYFLVNTLSVAAVIALTTSKSLYRVWCDCYLWLFPYYLVGATTAVLVSLYNQRLGWETTVLAAPIVYVLFRSYRLHLDRLEAEKSRAQSEKRHAEQMAALHLRTIEALAMAIEAKDNTTYNHLRRVQIYLLELGKKLQLPEPQLQALRAASILHDIGKLAVPEHIISKPGKLTAEEFQKMKIHPVVGAEILERVQFPWAVAPIVRSHHERWDGAGYPDGLKGEEIPLGARIISAVDCFDALASDRQYRRALPLDEAMGIIQSESGKAFDEHIVRLLEENYKGWEQLVQADSAERIHALFALTVARGEAPATGLQTPPSSPSQQPDVLSAIAAAFEKAQVLFELARESGGALNLQDTLALLDNRLSALIPYDAIAVYVCRDDELVACYVNGENRLLFSGLRIPIGQGLAGWVAQSGQSILNGNPSVEPGYLNDPTRFSTLRSALAVPLENAAGITGVLALYALAGDAFNHAHLRILQALTPKVSLILESTAEAQPALPGAAIDPLTGLPNAHALVLRLDAELARCRQAPAELAVLAGALDGLRELKERFGRWRADRVLQVIGAGLREAFRESDYVARCGGEAFILLLPGLPPPSLPEKLRLVEKAVLEASLAVCGEPLLHISLAAVFCSEQTGDAERILAEVDRRVLLAKAHTQRGPAAVSPVATLATSLENAIPVPRF